MKHVFQIQDPANPGGDYPRLLYVLTAVTALGGLLFGFDTGVISGALPYLRDSMLIETTNDQSKLEYLQETIVVAAIVAAGIGSTIGGWISDHIGRKKSLALSDILFILGALLMAAAGRPATIIVGRALVGLGIGLASVVVPVYIAECAPSSIRAQLVTFNVLAITMGQFVAYLSNYIFSYFTGTWRWMLGLGVVPAAAQLILLLPLPESPKWLANTGRVQQAEEAAVALGCEKDAYTAVDTQYHRIDTHRQQTTLQQLASVPKQLHIGIGLQVLQQLCGINTVMYYLPVIVQLAGVDDKRQALLFSLIPAGVNAAGTIVGMSLIDRHGRRKLLLCSLVGVFFSLLLLGIAFKVADNHTPALIEGSRCMLEPVDTCKACLDYGCGFDGSSNQCLPLPLQDSTENIYTIGCPSPASILVLIALILYLAAFSPGLGPVPWAVVSEIFPVNVRATAAGVAASSNWIANSLVAQTFLTLMRLYGGAGVFWLYACISLAGIVWVYRFLPETKGLSLDQVQQLF